MTLDNAGVATSEVSVYRDGRSNGGERRENAFTWDFLKAILMMLQFSFVKPLRTSNAFGMATCIMLPSILVAKMSFASLRHSLSRQCHSSGGFPS